MAYCFLSNEFQRNSLSNYTLNEHCKTQQQNRQLKQKICIPYTAVVPFLMLIVRWFAEQLSKRGLLPKKLAMMVGMAAPTKSKGDCCSKDVAATTNGKNSAKTGVVTTIETVEQFDSILQSQSNGYTVVKFTATWCKPCKAIQPFVDELAVLHSGAASFVSVDVDDLDDISGRYNVMAMPTFIAFHGGEKVDSMSGTKESKLEEFVKKNLPTVSLNKAKNM